MMVDALGIRDCDMSRNPGSNWGDVLRWIVGFLSTVVVLALLYEPPVTSWGLLAVAVTIAVVCVMTARNRRGVLMGILAILASRVIIALGLVALRYLRHS
jgi:hypothetical protein